MPDVADAPAPAAPPPAPPKPKAYRCPNGSYTITEAMCQGRQAVKFHLCPRCGDRAPVLGQPSPN